MCQADGTWNGSAPSCSKKGTISCTIKLPIVKLVLCEYSGYAEIINRSNNKERVHYLLFYQIWVTIVNWLFNNCLGFWCVENNHEVRVSYLISSLTWSRLQIEHGMDLSQFHTNRYFKKTIHSSLSNTFISRLTHASCCNVVQLYFLSVFLVEQWIIVAEYINVLAVLDIYFRHYFWFNSLLLKSVKLQLNTNLLP